MNYIDNKNILITGGTGSIGQAVFFRILDEYNPSRITIFSRDEYKHFRLRSLIANHPKKNIVQFVIGDIRDTQSVERVVRGNHVIFHCSALKHVPVSEENPEEFIKTNVNGALNIKKAALDAKVEILVGVSTDKAVNPTNVMGFTKSLQEKIFSSNYLDGESKTKFVNVRFGNVIDTKGSLFPILAHQIHNNLPLTITHTNMTRFFMTRSEAVDLIIDSAIVGDSGDTVVRKMHSVRIEYLFKMFLRAYGMSEDYPINVIGIRVGERLHEYLVSYDELLRMHYTDDQKYLVIPPYLHSEINQNIINDSLGKNENDSLYDFASENEKYFFTDDEILTCISVFQKDQAIKSKEII